MDPDPAAGGVEGDDNVVLTHHRLPLRCQERGAQLVHGAVHPEFDRIQPRGGDPCDDPDDGEDNQELDQREPVPQTLAGHRHGRRWNARDAGSGPSLVTIVHGAWKLRRLDSRSPSKERKSRIRHETCSVPKLETAPLCDDPTGAFAGVGKMYRESDDCSRSPGWRRRECCLLNPPDLR